MQYKDSIEKGFIESDKILQNGNTSYNITRYHRVSTKILCNISQLDLM